MKRKIKDEIGKDNPTADDVLDLIVGKDDFDYCDGDYVLYKEMRNTERTVIQRINFLWVVPLLLLMMPIVWIVTGDWGLSRNSRLGKIFEFMVKFER